MSGTTPGGRAIPGKGSYDPPKGPKGPAGTGRPETENKGNCGTQAKG